MQAIVLPRRGRLWSSSLDVVEFDVPLLDSYATGTSKVLAKVQIGRQDGWKSLGNGEGREISVVSSSIKGVVRHHGVRCVIRPRPRASN
jgi:hypothetical protein